MPTYTKFRTLPPAGPLRCQAQRNHTRVHETGVGPFTAYLQGLWRQIWVEQPQRKVEQVNPTSSGSSQAATPPSASSVPSWPSNTTTCVRGLTQTDFVLCEQPDQVADPGFPGAVMTIRPEFGELRVVGDDAVQRLDG